MASIPIILDCDPGHDDALAIALALARPELRTLAITVAWLAVPDLVTSVLLRIDIETAGIHTRGRTVADREGLAGRPANAEVGLTVDRARLMDLVVDAIGGFG